MTELMCDIAGACLGCLAVLGGFAIGVSRGRRLEKLDRERHVSDGWREGYGYGEFEASHEGHCDSYREGYEDAKAGKECKP